MNEDINNPTQKCVPPKVYWHAIEEECIDVLQVPQSTLDLDGVKSILGEYRIHNADITLRCDATADDLIDIVEGNRYSTHPWPYYHGCQ